MNQAGLSVNFLTSKGLVEKQCVPGTVLHAANVFQEGSPQSLCSFKVAKSKVIP